MDEESIRADLVRVRDFMSQSLTTGGLVHQEMKKALLRVEDTLATMANLSLTILGTDGSQMTLKVAGSTSFQDLHKRIQVLSEDIFRSQVHRVHFSFL